MEQCCVYNAVFLIVKVLTSYLEPIDILCPHFDNGITTAVK